MKVYLLQEIDDMESSLSKMHVFKKLRDAFDCAAEYHRKQIRLGDGVIDEEFIESERQKVISNNFKEYYEIDCLDPGEGVGIIYTIRRLTLH